MKHKYNTSEIVYRIEHGVTGTGFFQNAKGVTTSKFWRGLVKSFYDMPTLMEEFDYNYSFLYYCAFLCVDDIPKYIQKKYFKRLLELGFKVYMLELSTVSKTQHQAFYQKTDVISKVDVTSEFSGLYEK